MSVKDERRCAFGNTLKKVPLPMFSAAAWKDTLTWGAPRNIKLDSEAAKPILVECQPVGFESGPQNISGNTRTFTYKQGNDFNAEVYLWLATLITAIQLTL